MINVSGVTLSYGKRVLFKDVNIKFTPGNCYGLIGANGPGKSTFLNILSGEIHPDKGEVSIGPRERIAVLKQDQFAFDEETVFNTVIMGHERLYQIMHERELIYSKGRFQRRRRHPHRRAGSGIREMNGKEAIRGSGPLNGLGIPEELRHKKMKDWTAEKVRVLLAQPFRYPDVLCWTNQPTT
jgi:ATPase subunit of ABC transporter with duplicated ATPase domains